MRISMKICEHATRAMGGESCNFYCEKSYFHGIPENLFEDRYCIGCADYNLESSAPVRDKKVLAENTRFGIYYRFAKANKEGWTVTDKSSKTIMLFSIGRIKALHNNLRAWSIVLFKYNLQFGIVRKP